jgi:hypothetical protein
MSPKLEVANNQASGSVDRGEGGAVATLEFYSRVCQDNFLTYTLVNNINGVIHIFLLSNYIHI